MIWVVMGFDRSTDEAVQEWDLPADFTEENAEELVGPSLELIGSSWPLSDEQLAVIEGVLGVRTDSRAVSYFLEAQDDTRGRCMRAR